MQRLSGTDSLFLAGETPAWHQHVGALSIIDPTGVPDFCFESVVDRIASRLPAIPKLMWKLKELPLHLDRAYWVPDPDFDVRRHVLRYEVAPPGGEHETATAIGHILGEQLDRRFPLWEIWYLDGLVNGRVGFLMKYHHCLLDGVSGSAMAALLLDCEPSPPDLSLPQPPRAEPAPNNAGLLLESLVSGLATPWRVARYGARVVRRAFDTAAYALSNQPKPDVSAMLKAPRTSFNRTIGPRRAMAFTSVAKDDVLALRSRYGVKFNDVALALCSGALRTYLADRAELPARTLTAGVPVSTRATGDEGLDNQISYMIVPLATDVGPPGERLLAIHRGACAAKELSADVRAHPIGSIGAAVPPWALGVAMRIAYASHVLSHVPGMTNTIVSSVAGPTFPLFLAGAPLTGIFSASVILEGMGVNITIFTFEGRVDFGIHVDPDLVPDPWALAAAIPRALAELMRAGGLGEPSAVEDAFGLSGG